MIVKSFFVSIDRLRLFVAVEQAFKISGVILDYVLWESQLYFVTKAREPGIELVTFLNLDGTQEIIIVIVMINADILAKAVGNNTGKALMYPQGNVDGLTAKHRKSGVGIFGNIDLCKKLGALTLGVFTDLGVLHFVNTEGLGRGGIGIIAQNIVILVFPNQRIGALGVKLVFAVGIFFVDKHQLGLTGIKIYPYRLVVEGDLIIVGNYR